MRRKLAYWLSVITLVCCCCHTQPAVKDAADVPQEEAPPVAEEVESSGTELNIPLREEVTPPEEVEEITETPTEPEAQVEIDPENTSLALRIIRWKNKIDQGIWWECGKKYTPEELKVAALEWATAINAAYATTEYTLRSGKTVKVCKREAMGLMMSETRLDRCAVGPYPRKFAYKHKLLKRHSRTLSHTLEDIEKVFTHPKFQGRQADIGPGQIVFRIGRGKDHIKWEEARAFLTVEPGVKRVFTEMAARGTMYSTKTPSNRWPGSQKHSWYTHKVLRFSEYIFNDAWYK